MGEHTPIPVKVAEKIAKEFGYDQVMIYARKVDVPAGVGETAKAEVKGGEHMTTYGINAKHCAAAAQIGDFLKFKIMGWTEEEAHEDRRYDALVKALQVLLDEATSFNVSGVYFDEECMGHKGPALARAALDAVGSPQDTNAETSNG